MAKVLTEVLDEATADQQVIKVLLEIIRKLKKENSMSVLVFDKDGNTFLAHQFEAVSSDELDSQVAILQNSIENVAETRAAITKLLTVEAPTPIVSTPVSPVEVPVVPVPADAPTPTPATDPTIAVDSTVTPPVDPATPPTPVVLQ